MINPVMTNFLLVLPILIPLTAAILMLLAGRRINVQRWLGVGGAAGLLGAGLSLFGVVRAGDIVAVQIGAWPAPFGITLVADLFSAVVLVMIGLIGLAVAVYGLTTLDDARQHDGYHPIVQTLLTALSGAVLTGDLFNLFVWFEVMLISSFVLLALGGGRNQIEGAFKYVALNLFASSLFLAAVGHFIWRGGHAQHGGFGAALCQRNRRTGAGDDAGRALSNCFWH